MRDLLIQLWRWNVLRGGEVKVALTILEALEMTKTEWVFLSLAQLQTGSGYLGKDIQESLTVLKTRHILRAENPPEGRRWQLWPMSSWIVRDARQPAVEERWRNEVLELNRREAPPLLNIITEQPGLDLAAAMRAAVDSGAEKVEFVHHLTYPTDTPDLGVKHPPQATADAGEGLRGAGPACGVGSPSPNNMNPIQAEALARIRAFGAKEPDNWLRWWPHWELAALSHPSSTLKLLTHRYAKRAALVSIESPLAWLSTLARDPKVNIWPDDSKAFSYRNACLESASRKTGTPKT